MNDAAPDRLPVECEAGAGAVRRRHVIYVSGYDPRGARGYYDMFRRTCERFRILWPITLSLQPLEKEAGDFACWSVHLGGAGWQVATQYDFLRMESFIRADMARRSGGQMLRALGWWAGDIVSGAQWRIFRAAWRFALHLWYFQLLTLAWLAVTAAFALAAGVAVSHIIAAPVAACLAASIFAAFAAGFATLVVLRPLADRWRVVQIASCWSTLRRFGRGRPTWIDAVVERGARRLSEVAGAGQVEEIVVVGHSTGGVIACAIVARAIERDPDFARGGPRLALLTLGSVMPAVALHPAAQRMRDIVRRLAVEERLDWIDCQARTDVMCFANFDPVDGIGVDVGGGRRNPLLWRISFKDMIAPDDYDRFRWNHFRVHYQYIMAGDRPAPYDYVLLVAGPLPIAAWPQRNREFTATLVNGATSAPDTSRRDIAIGAAP